MFQTTNQYPNMGYQPRMVPFGASVSSCPQATTSAWLPTIKTRALSSVPGLEDT